jgi:hypothetical protein
MRDTQGRTLKLKLETEKKPELELPEKKLRSRRVKTRQTGT